MITTTPKNILKLRSPIPPPQAKQEAVKKMAGADGVMVFQPGPVELPNVIQYLNVSKHTGKLEVDPKTLLSERGVIGFRDGEAYYARQGIKRGIDAIVEMVNYPSAEAVFFPGENGQETNIDIPTRDLILEAAVRADEKPPRIPVQSDSDPDDFILGERVASRILITDRKRAHGGDNDGPGPKKSRYWVIVLSVLALGALGINGVWLLGQIHDRRIRRAKARVQDETAHQQAALNAARKKKIDDLLFEGVSALKKSDLTVAEQKAEVVLAVDPGNKPALDLQQRVTKAANLNAVIPLRGKAAAAREKLTRLGEDPLFKHEAAAIGNRHDQGELYYTYKDYEKAIVEFRAFIKEANTLFDQKSQCEEAKAARKKCAAARLQSASACTSKDGTGLGDQAIDKEKLATGLFEKKAWSGAAKTWGEATQLFVLASQKKSDFSSLRSAESEFKKAMGTVNEGILKKYAANDAELIQKNKRQALDLEESGDLIRAAQLWVTNTTLLKTAWEKVSRRHAADMYTDRMEVARQAMRRQDWDKAVEALNELRGLEKLKQNTGVMDLWEQASYNRYISQLPALQASENWQELKSVARKIMSLKANDPTGRQAMKLAEDKLLPRLRFEVTSMGKGVPRCDVRIQGSAAAAESPLVYRLTPGGTYIFHLQLPPANGIYFKAVTYNYSPSDSGTQTVKIDIPPISPPQFGVSWNVPGTTLMFVPLPGGVFRMGGSERREQQPQHTVHITRPFWMARTETTNRQFRMFVEQEKYDGDADCPRGYLKHFSQKTDVSTDDLFPVVYISWKNAEAFCQWLTRREKRRKRLPEGYVYRLPTEAEWEYACRAGSVKNFTMDPSAEAWYGNRSKNNAGTGLLKPNNWGLYDMHGNVWEFCQDWYAAYSADEQTDPVGPRKGIFKVYRGGSWRDSVEQSRCSWRSQIPVVEARNNVGFRVVLAPAL